MKKTNILFMCAVMLLMSGCSSTAQQEVTEISSVINSTLDTNENLQTSEETTTTVFTEDTTAPETTPISSEINTRTEEEKQIQNLLQESKKIFYDYVLGKEMQNHVGWSKSITIQKTNNLGESYDSKIYEIVDGDVLSFADMREKMRPFFTDKMIDYVFEECNYYYYKENGKLYVSDGVGSEGGGVGVDTVHITSAENADENTIILNMIEFGAGENWGLDYDLVDNFTITLKRTDNGFKIDECDKADQERIARCYVPEDDIFS